MTFRDGRKSYLEGQIDKTIFIQAIKGHVRKLIECRKSLRTSDLNMEAIPVQLKMIEGQGELMHTQIQGALGNMFEEIKNIMDIGEVSDKGWVHWEGASYRGGEVHA